MPDTRKASVEIGYSTTPAEDEDVAAAAGRLESGTLRKAAKPTRFVPREVIYREGEEADTVYAIRSGLAKLISYLPNGKGRIVRLYGRGIWIGLEGLLRRPYEHTAVAVEAVEVYRFRTQTLRLLEHHDFGHHVYLMSKWHQHLLEADLWISEFSTGPIRPRVARLLAFLTRVEDRMASGSVRLLTCDEMAAVLGVTPESVSRVLAEFKRSGILSAMESSSPPELYRCDAASLERVAWQ